MLRTGWHKLRFTGAGIALTATMAFFGPIPADADMVYGTVFNEKGNPQPGLTFRVEGRIKKDVTTGNDGSYRVFLPPGIYSVQSGAGKAVIQSIPEPFRQDIRLK